jgi:hypothetical protein
MTFLIALNFIALVYFLYRVHTNLTNSVKPLKQAKEKSFDEKLNAAALKVRNK